MALSGPFYRLSCVNSIPIPPVLSYDIPCRRRKVWILHIQLVYFCSEGEKVISHIRTLTNLVPLPIRGSRSETTNFYLFTEPRERWPKWLEREFTDRKVRDSNPTSASRLALSRLGQPGSIPALVLPSGGMAARHRKGATAERFLLLSQSRTRQIVITELSPRGGGGRDGPSGYSASLLTGGSVVRTRPQRLDFPCLGLGNPVVPQPSCFFRVAWHLCTGRVSQLNNFSPRGIWHPSSTSSLRNRFFGARISRQEHVPYRVESSHEGTESEKLYSTQCKLLYHNTLVGVKLFLALLEADTVVIQTILYNLNYSASRFGMRFTPAKCKVLLQDWTSLSTLAAVSVQVAWRKMNVRAAFVNIRHLWRRRSIHLTVKGQVYSTAVCSIFLCGSETWPSS
ncbi:hypothetical protein T265_00906 [Opisthorchis viverrini]|uniref:Reverse transcriptase domain-containing protein n=1 Tax=Opisthorchis viverrini TaxID=6198 RepID=A0A075A4N0_OPIVI|nr:hypothetical protein T265_00906 [Opisthorchis viverrini]KER33217.1 hypothetical protein T265_00906 [Opisthorchis viverrini]